MVDLHLARFHSDVPLRQVVDAAPGSQLALIMDLVLQSIISSCTCSRPRSTAGIGSYLAARPMGIPCTQDFKAQTVWTESDGKSTFL